MLHEGLTTGQAAKHISRHPKTWQAMDRAGVLPARRTARGRRYGLRADLDRYLGRTAAERPRRTVCYGRVSSQAQCPVWKKQRRIVKEFAIAQGMANLEFIEEMGGGLNCKRSQFTARVDSVVADELALLVVAHPDRWARFGFERLPHLCRKHGCEWLVVPPEKDFPEQEMEQDGMAIRHGFSCRLDGLGNDRRAWKEAFQ
jgi:predicted site-specific integrase-resolvase